MKQVLSLLAAPVFPAVVAFLVFGNLNRLPFRDTNGQVTLKEAIRLEKPLWVDSRSNAAYSAEHIPGAIHLEESTWSESLVKVLDAWQPERPVIIYCGSRSCETSQNVAHRLVEETGWKNVYVLEGGWEAWKHGRK